MKFTATVSLNQLPEEFDNEESALKAFITAVRKEVENGRMNPQLLETACWIEAEDRFLYSFYDARDRAYELGLLDKAGYVK